MLRARTGAVRRPTLTLAAVVALTTIGMPWAGGASRPAEPAAGEPLALDRNIYLTARVLEDPGIDAGFVAGILGSPRPVHGIVQLHTLPKPGDLELVEALGIDLLGYLNGVTGPGTAYLASISPSLDVAGPAFSRLVRAVQPLVPADKRPVTLPRPSDEVIDLSVLFFDDVGASAARRVLAGHGVSASSLGASALYAGRGTAAAAHALSEEDAVQWVERAQAPRELIAQVRAASRVDQVQQLDTSTGVYGGLTGDGVQMGIMDSDFDDLHPDFAGRVIRVHDDGPSGTHGTAVAGIAAGSGAQSAANGATPFFFRGVAPEADIAAYRQISDNPATFNEAINTFGVDVSNHSYGMDDYGRYNTKADAFDGIIRGDSPSVPARPAVIAAGNNGAPLRLVDCDGDGTPEAFPQYPSGCPSAYHTGYFSLLTGCKNCINVANINDSIIHHVDSSIGPTLDGRIKPEISAIGNCVDNVLANTTGYGQCGSGTSLAAPAIAGIIALMLEQYALTFGVNLDSAPPLPSTSKAILIQTAQDLRGTDPTINFDTGQPLQYGPGPDWATGYGLADAPEAAEQVRDGAFVEDVVGMTDHTDDHTFTVSPGETLNRVTLAWDDRPGEPNANDAARQLVNDLDLVLLGPNGEVHHPLVLPHVTPRDCDVVLAGVQVGTCVGQDDPNQNYLGPAAEGIDRINNVEQVVLSAPGGLAPGTWTARVSVLNPDGLTVRLPEGGTQPYSLALDANEVPLSSAGGPYTTNEGTDAPLSASGTTDVDGDDLVFAWDLDGDGQFDDANGASPSFTNVGGDGAFPVCVRATDPAGAFDDGCTQVIVNNVAPSVTGLLTDSPKPENATVTLTGTITDPGWEDPLSVSVAWGDGTGGPTVTGAEEHLRPDGTLEFTATAVFGDDGPFTVEVCGLDDDGQTCDSSAVATFTNVDPDAEIDLAGATDVNGTPTILGTAGQPVSFSGNAKDPGSDDLRLSWDWDDGTPGPSTLSLNDAAIGGDPDPSPSINPRDVDDSRTHTFGDACVYEPSLTVDDDDAGSDTDRAAVLVTGNAENNRPAGWWQDQYNGEGPSLGQDVLLCYLEIARFGSPVFEETVPLGSISEAHAVLHLPGDEPHHLRRFDRNLLAAWLNFANGGVGFDEIVADTDGDGAEETSFGAALAAAEAVRNSAASTKSEIEAQREILRSINQPAS